ncbi:MAG: hypothetical protein JWQ95_3574 [Sphaerisporangium sp.]|jgi:hypothetical protein|nr:hypothetical protein [Sphaerisporangium sp.]
MMTGSYIAQHWGSLFPTPPAQTPPRHSRAGIVLQRSESIGFQIRDRVRGSGGQCRCTPGACRTGSTASAVGVDAVERWASYCATACALASPGLTGAGIRNKGLEPRCIHNRRGRLVRPPCVAPAWLGEHGSGSYDHRPTEFRPFSSIPKHLTWSVSVVRLRSIRVPVRRRWIQAIEGLPRLGWCGLCTGPEVLANTSANSVAGRPWTPVEDDQEVIRSEQVLRTSGNVDRHSSADL